MKTYRKIIIDLFVTPNVTVDAGGVNRSNGYVINAYGNTIDTSGNTFTPEQAKFYSKVFQKNYTGKLVHGQFGEKQTFPKHSGNVINIRGMTPYPTATTPLQEGVTPKGNVMNFYYIEVAVNPYGAYTPTTDWAGFTSRDDILIHDAEELSSQAGRTIEEIDAEMLNSGTQVIYAPAVTSDGTITEVTTRKAITKLSKFRVDTIYRALNFLENQNAEPIGDSFVAIIHPNTKYDVMRDPEFISVVKYNQDTRIYKGEIGMIGNIRFVVSTYAKVFKGAGAESIDVYSTLVIAKGAYKVLEIEGEGMQTIIKPLGSGGTADPLNQRATQGWKTTHGIGITCEPCIVRVESASTLNTQTLSATINESADYVNKYKRTVEWT